MNDFILIANSGIQYLTTRLEIDTNSGFSLFFHEWFDEKEVQQDLEFAYAIPNGAGTYRWEDLRKRGFIDKNGKLNAHTAATILADPNLKPLQSTQTSHFYNMKFSDKTGSVILRKLFNQWLPVPFLEISDSQELKSTPYNWCRCKVIPTEITDEKIVANILFAFDTRSLYAPNEDDDRDEFHEYPYFETSSELKKEFQLCDDKSLLLNYCTIENSWVRSFIMRLVHGVTDLGKVPFDANNNKYQFMATYMLLIEYIAHNVDLPKVILYRDRDVEKINVEMIVDIGNSRTAAVLYEQNFTKVQTLRLQNFENPVLANGMLNRTQESFDMGIAFQKVDFGRKSQEASRQFVWPAIVRLGVEAAHLKHQTINISQGNEVFSTYSSPKRYLWDDRRRREEWRCVGLNKEGQNDTPIIEGVSNYFDDNGQLNEYGFGYGNHYSRKTLMTLAFIEILAQSNVQINSYDYRTFLGKPATPRVLDKIILTCPTGMSKREQQALHDCLKDAIYVLTEFYKNNDKTYTPLKISIIPDLDQTEEKKWIFDEATCSQFVYLYGLFSETYLGQSVEFFNIYGKRRPLKKGGDAPSIVIGSLDIGAGTSDVMICQYTHDANLPTRLKPEPLFWDSFNTAGDDMLRQLISNVLLQGKDGILEQEMIRRGLTESQFRTILYQFVGGNHREKSFRDQVLRRDFNTQVLVPLMYYFLQLHSDGETYKELHYQNIFEKEVPSQEVIDAFYQHFGVDLSSIVWIFDRNIVSRHIERSMDDLLSKIAHIMYSYDCDVVILSGRPTSLEPIKDTFLKYFPVASANRLVILNKHRVGVWYPFANEFGYLSNSKSVVPIGAMIGYLASSAGGYNNFSLDLSLLGERLTPTTDFFLINNATASINKSFITPKQSVGTLRPDSFPVFIGCKQFDLSLYPVRPFFVLDFDEDAIMNRIRKDKTLSSERVQQEYMRYTQNILQYSPLKFTIEREDYQEEKELLAITGVENCNGDLLDTNDFHLTVQSLNDPECYWLDSGSFEINISCN